MIGDGAALGVATAMEATARRHEIRRSEQFGSRCSEIGFWR